MKSTKYSKDIILKADQFRNSQDILNALLDDNKQYSAAEAEKIIAEYKTRKVG